MVGFGPTIHPAAHAGIRWTMDPRDTREDDSGVTGFESTCYWLGSALASECAFWLALGHAVLSTAAVLSAFSAVALLIWWKQRQS